MDHPDRYVPATHLPRERPVPDRCRVVLVPPAELAPADVLPALRDAMEGGDIASIIVPAHEMGERAYTDHVRDVAALAQPAGIAVVADRDVRVASRLGLDGVHLPGDMDELSDVIERVAGRMSVGVEDPRNRDRAMEMGEAGPDYVMFGRVGGDTHEAPNPKMLDLAEWWASMIEIPAMIVAGTDLDGAVDCAATGAEFVALSRAVFAEEGRAREMVSRANTMLDENAPRFAPRAEGNR